MEGIRTIAVSIGCTALICGLVEMIAPKDRFKGIIETVIGLFALISVVALFKGYSFDSEKLSVTVAEISSSAQQSFDKTLEQEYTDVIYRCFEEKLKENGVDYDNISIVTAVKDNNLTVEKVVIVTKQDGDIIKKIGDELGIITEIERNAPTDD